MDLIALRLREALDSRNMRQSELSNKTGIAKSSISTYLAGSYRPKQDKIYAMARALDVNPAWLSGMDAPMDRPTGINSAKFSYDKLSALDHYLKVLGWNVSDDIDDESLVIISDGSTSFKVSFSEYHTLADDALDFFIDRIQLLLNESASNSMKQSEKRRNELSKR